MSDHWCRGPEPPISPCCITTVSSLNGGGGGVSRCSIALLKSMGLTKTAEYSARLLPSSSDIELSGNASV